MVERVEIVARIAKIGVRFDNSSLCGVEAVDDAGLQTWRWWRKKL